MSRLYETLRRSASACLERFGARGLFHRRRRMLRLARARENVASALAEGRLSPAVGEALAGHLEALQRDCARSRED